MESGIKFKFKIKCKIKFKFKLEEGKMRKLTHESLTVYQRSIEFVAWASDLCRTKSLTGVVLDQFKRAFISIPLNIAEGSGKHTRKDQSKFYDIARGSALECGACLDVLVAMKLVDAREIEIGKSLIGEIVAMLTALTKSIAGDRLREEESDYTQET
jgi:four helix bundle protein